MKRILIATLLPATALLLLPSLRTRATEIVFAPEEGLVLQKTGKAGLDMELQSVTIMAGDEDMSPDDAPEMTQVFSGNEVYTDTYVSVDDGVVTKLERTYDELSERQVIEGTPDSDEDSEYESPLEGATVIFTWDGDEEEYSVAFDEGEELDEELLADLENDTDLIAFLPDGEVEEGDTWEVELDGLDGFISFGGDLHYDRDDEDEEDDLFDEAMDENLEGKVTCTFEGMRDGLALITLELEGESEAEKESSEESEGVDVTSTESVSVELNLEGELLWNVEGGHYASFKMAGSFDLTMGQGVHAEFDGESFDQTFEMEFEGELSMELEAEAL